MVDIKLVLLLLQASYCLTSAFMVDGDTCSGRCGATVDSSKVCQCNSACVRYNDCCSDYNSLCVQDTCQNRCGATHDTTKVCQCNSACLRFNDCCSDYQSLCTGGAATTHASGAATTHASGTCQTLAAISAELWANDVNRLSGSDVTVNYQTQVPDGTTSDRSTQKFFTHVNEAKLTTGTYKLLIDLLDNYDPAKGTRESLTAQETQEDNAFLDAILGTSVMNSLLKFLTCKGIVSSQSELKAALKKIWFDFYPRSGSSTIPDTSGFEHVIVGEYKDNSVVNGFHNWVSFYEKEKSGSLNYFGYVRKTEPSIVGAAFSWSNHVKTMGSFFIGVSPEFEIAVYSLCFMTNPGKACHITLNGHPVSIMSYSTNGHLATAYEGEGKPKNRTTKGRSNSTEGLTKAYEVISADITGVTSAATLGDVPDSITNATENLMATIRGYESDTITKITDIGNDTSAATFKTEGNFETVLIVHETHVRNTITRTDKIVTETTTAYKGKRQQSSKRHGQHTKKQPQTKKQKPQRKKEQLSKETTAANSKSGSTTKVPQRKSKKKSRKSESETGSELKTIHSVEDQHKHDKNKASA